MMQLTGVSVMSAATAVAAAVAAAAADLLSLQLPAETFAGGEGILWVAAKTKIRFRSDSLPVLVLDGDPTMTDALKNM
jgi:hypothetical protein